MDAFIPNHEHFLDPKDFKRVESNTSISYESTPKLRSLDEKWTYISEIDFFPMFESITNEEKNTVFQPLVSEEVAEEIFKQYKRYLYLLCKYEGQIYFSPTAAMDIGWHLHILDTHAYHRDCSALFGQYMHHYPYFGARGEEDFENLKNAFNNTLKLYELEFGEKIINDS